MKISLCDLNKVKFCHLFSHNVTEYGVLEKYTSSEVRYIEIETMVRAKTSDPGFHMWIDELPCTTCNDFVKVEIKQRTYVVLRVDANSTNHIKLMAVCTARIAPLTLMFSILGLIPASIILLLFDCYSLLCLALAGLVVLLVLNIIIFFTYYIKTIDYYELEVYKFPVLGYDHPWAYNLGKVETRNRVYSGRIMDHGHFGSTDGYNTSDTIRILERVGYEGTPV